MGRPRKRVPLYPNRLHAIRSSRGISGTKLAETIGMDRSSYYRYEGGDYALSLRDTERLARALGCSPSDILPGAERRLVPIKGYVGAGAQIFPIEDFPGRTGMDEILCPTDLDPDITSALVVRGDSMLPLTDGWIVFYLDADYRTPADLLGELCVVKLANGALMLKQLRRGPTKGRFNLVSSNAPLIEDAEIESAARVADLRPPQR